MSGNEEAVVEGQGASTNGWDAVLALDYTQVNALFFQQYLQLGPMQPLAGLRLRTMLSVGESSTYWILDALLGPPEWSFQAYSENGTLEMELVKGALIAFDSGGIIHDVVHVRPKESKLTGSLELAKVKGEVSPLGSVVADLGASAYHPHIVGVDPGSVLNTAIGEAISTFFANNQTQFHLGAIAPGKVAALTPTSFHFAVQRKGTSNDACVLLLIKTDGTEGNIGPLPAYPIPDGHSSSLAISERALFCGPLAASLNASFGGAGFSGSRAGEHWMTTSGGGATLWRGQVNNRNTTYPNGAVWSSDSNSNESPLGLSSNGFSLQASGGKILAKWSYKQPQTWSVYNCSIPIGGLPSVCGAIPFGTAVQVDYSQTFDLIMNPGADNSVSFKSTSLNLALTPTDVPSGWDKFWAGVGLPSSVQDEVKDSLRKSFEGFSLQDINTFTLTSLLFPNKHAVHLEQVTLSAGLDMAGRMDQPISVAPASTTLSPGEHVQFSVAGQAAADFLWEIKPHVGGITAAGLYTAPAKIGSAELVVITAISRKDASSASSAMVLVREKPASGGIAVAPGDCLVTPGQQIQLSTTDKDGKPISVDWTLTPNIGQIRPALGQGLYVYVAPPAQSEAVQVTASAVGSMDHQLTGKATLRVVPASTVSITPAQSSLKCGASLGLLADVPAEDADDVCWVVFPSGSGKIVADADHPGKAIYTAPAKIPQGNQVFVVAYKVDDQTAGLGIAVINLQA
ncbi:hypothetical protein ACPA5B_18900 [Pseudomonas solani]|uniref:hypothetical protein n=1 Tax=Pseudomonas solani TaxID=2731552 RepID=UPI003C2CFA4C